MRILALETVDTSGSVAAHDDDRLLVERPLEPSKRSAQTLVPTMAEVLTEVGWKPRDVELVAVTTGPGSFTGLRIGVTTAKTFAYAAGCQVIGVHTLEVIASRVPAEFTRFSVVLDAQRSELFVGDFARDASGAPRAEGATRIADAAAWCQSLADGSVVTGTGLAKYRELLGQCVTVIDPALWRPTATAVGQLGWRYNQAGGRVSVFDLVPQYFRRTAAEEQWERKHPT